MDDAVDVGDFTDADIAGAFAASGADATSLIPTAGRRPSSPLSDIASRLWRLGSLYVGQGGLILKGRQSQGQHCAVVVPPVRSELLYLPTCRHGRIAALFGPALYPDGSPRSDAAHRPTLLFFYGNGMCLSETIPLFEHLRRIGANVLVPEYLGYGLSDGAAGERACYETADAAWQHLLRRRDIDTALIVAAGVSLGGAVAIDLAAREPEVAGLIALVTFTSIPDMARHLHPDVPIWRFIHLKFNSLSKIGRVTCPALIGHSTADALVPAWMADRLASAAGGPVTRLIIEGANHHAAEMLEVGGGVIFDAAQHFLESLRTARTEASI